MGTCETFSSKNKKETGQRKEAEECGKLGVNNFDFFSRPKR